MLRKKIIAGNWKMNMSILEAKNFIMILRDKINVNKCEVVLCVPFLCIPKAIELLENTNILVGAQNMHFEENGPYTGEISAKMLKEIGVKYVILGHSERRIYFLETDEIVNKKVIKAIEYGINPIICVGETLEEREQNIVIDVIRIQIKKALVNVEKDKVINVVIAYEPIWAIGTGKTASSNEAEEICRDIRCVLAEVYDNDIANKIRIQYGGSVNKSNASELFSMSNIDGGLIGGASLKAEFENIVNY